MNPDASQLWRGPRWTLALLLASLATIGPFSIDTYLPAFPGIAATLSATPVQMQQTLSSYLFGFALMNLFHGALSDGLGRRPVILSGLGAFTLASLGCAFAGTIAELVFWRAVQGMAAGAGMVVSRAIIRDMYPPAEAQRVMSQVTLYFGIAPAIAPVVGGWLYVLAGWRAVFGFLVTVGAALLIANLRLLPETLHASQRQPIAIGPLLRGYAGLLGDPRFIALAFASGVPFNGFFLYVLASPEWLGRHLDLGPTQFFWFFVTTVGGVMAGAWWSGRLAGQLPPRRQIRRGFRIMVLATVINLSVNLVMPPHPASAIAPVALYAFGWSLMVPAVTLMLLDLAPQRRGMAASLHACISSIANGLVAGVLVPLVMHSTLALSIASMGLMAIGLLSWRWIAGRLT